MKAHGEGRRQITKGNDENWQLDSILCSLPRLRNSLAVLSLDLIVKFNKCASSSVQRMWKKCLHLEIEASL